MFESEFQIGNSGYVSGHDETDPRAVTVSRGRGSREVLPWGLEERAVEFWRKYPMAVIRGMR